VSCTNPVHTCTHGLENMQYTAEQAQGKSAQTSTLRRPTASLSSSVSPPSTCSRFSCLTTCRLLLFHHHPRSHSHSVNHAEIATVTPWVAAITRVGLEAYVHSHTHVDMHRAEQVHWGEKARASRSFDEFTLAATTQPRTHGIHVCKDPAPC
jgi:hypothetical protein